jgi:hypothetical protein
VWKPYVQHCNIQGFLFLSFFFFFLPWRHPIGSIALQVTGLLNTCLTITGLGFGDGKGLYYRKAVDKFPAGQQKLPLELNSKT